MSIKPLVKVGAEMRFQVQTSIVGEFRVARSEGKGMTLSGYPAKFNKLSRDLGGFRENILPGAFRSTLAGQADVRALMNHNPDLILGRTTSGTLRLVEDQTGLAMNCDLPDTQTARDLATSIDRGDINQGSFRFRVNTDNWRQMGGETIRDLSDVELMDVSVVTFPAYEDTVASVRSISEAVGLDFERLNGILLRHSHALGTTSEDQKFIREVIAELHPITRIPELERMSRELDLAERC